MAKYLALICDIVGSRNIPNRLDAQRNIHEILEQNNTQFSALISSRITLTLGDEFQALLTPNAAITRLIDVLERQLRDYPFRVGIGYGEIITEINPLISIGADGPAFWKAREAIGWVRAKGANNKVRTAIRGFGGLHDNMLNALFQSTDAIKASWTDRQIEVFGGILTADKYTSTFSQNELARRLGISTSSLCKRLQSGNIKTYLASREVIGRAIEEWHNEIK